MTTTTINSNANAPRVYVGTFAKYNAGNLTGAWVDITDFDCYDDFIDYCKKIHADEAEPEFMMQDFDGLLDALYTECMDEETFDNIIECAKHDNPEAVNEYIKHYGVESLGNFNNAYQGEFISEVDFAYHIVNECYNLDSMMGNLASYFDYNAFARDLFMCDYTFVNGFVFRD